MALASVWPLAELLAGLYRQPLDALSCAAWCAPRGTSFLHKNNSCSFQDISLTTGTQP